MPSADQLIAVVWRRRLTFLLTVVCVVAAVAAVTYSLPKTYSSSAYLVISTANPSTSDFAAQQVSQVATQTTAELLQTRNTADQVASQLPYPASAGEVQGRVSIAPVASTQLVLITASESTPLRAQQLANTYATVFAQRTGPTLQFANVSLSEPAPLVTSPSGPHVHVYLLIGALLALLAGAGAAVLRDRLDRRLRIEDSVTELLGLPILARVADVSSRRLRGDRTTPQHHDIRFIEGFRWIFANLAFVSGGERPSLIAVVSAGEQEGKSTVCVALADAAAEILTGGVLLVDADLRRPALADRLSPEDADGGLSEYLAGSALNHNIEQLVRRVPDSAIGLVPAGAVPPNPAALLSVRAFDEFLEDVRETYEFVIFDTPPLRVGADASLVAARADGAVLVVDGRNSRRSSIEWSLGQLRRAGVNVLGVIINRISEPSSLSYYADPNTTRGRTGRGARRDPPVRLQPVTGDDRATGSEPPVPTEPGQPRQR